MEGFSPSPMTKTRSKISEGESSKETLYSNGHEGAVQSPGSSAQLENETSKLVVNGIPSGSMEAEALRCNTSVLASSIRFVASAGGSRAREIDGGRFVSSILRVSFAQLNEVSHTSRVMSWFPSEKQAGI